MMNQLQIFNNEEFGQVRAIAIDGNEFFYGVDIAKSLGYARPSKAVSDNCKVSLLRTPLKTKVVILKS